MVCKFNRWNFLCEVEQQSSWDMVSIVGVCLVCFCLSVSSSVSFCLWLLRDLVRACCRSKEKVLIDDSMKCSFVIAIIKFFETQHFLHKNPNFLCLHFFFDKRGQEIFSMLIQTSTWKSETLSSLPVVQFSLWLGANYPPSAIPFQNPPTPSSDFTTFFLIINVTNYSQKWIQQLYSRYILLAHLYAPSVSFSVCGVRFQALLHFFRVRDLFCVCYNFFNQEWDLTLPRLSLPKIQHFPHLSLIQISWQFVVLFFRRMIHFWGWSISFPISAAFWINNLIQTISPPSDPLW